MSSEEDEDQYQTFSTDMNPPADSQRSTMLSEEPINIATISSGFEQSDFLVRESKGKRVYFDFFEEAFNYLASKGYARMKGETLKEWMDIIESAHNSIPDGTTYRTGTLIMIMFRPVQYSRADQRNGTKVENVSGDSASRRRSIGSIHNDENNESPFV